MLWGRPETKRWSGLRLSQDQDRRVQTRVVEVRMKVTSCFIGQVHFT